MVDDDFVRFYFGYSSFDDNTPTSFVVARSGLDLATLRCSRQRSRLCRRLILNHEAISFEVSALSNGSVVEESDESMIELPRRIPILRREGAKPEIYTREHEKLRRCGERIWLLFVDSYCLDGWRTYHHDNMTKDETILDGSDDNKAIEERCDQFVVGPVGAFAVF
ncbi:hypothetical protein Dimus_024312 [Dionaea muscipula]